MVRNHHEKYKDMAESVLPSTRRRAAREDRQAIHQRHRAQTRAALADYRRSGDPVDVETHVRATPDREIHDFVWDRRSADKVGPLIRWAIRRVERDPQLRDADVATQTAAFRSMFPDNLIGRHAIDHIRWALTWRAEGNGTCPGALIGVGRTSTRWTLRCAAFSRTASTARSMQASGVLPLPTRGRQTAPSPVAMSSGTARVVLSRRTGCCAARTTSMNSSATSHPHRPSCRSSTSSVDSAVTTQSSARVARVAVSSRGWRSEQRRFGRRAGRPAGRCASRCRQRIGRRAHREANVGAARCWTRARSPP